jgi:hypothetical protein
MTSRKKNNRTKGDGEGSVILLQCTALTIALRASIPLFLMFFVDHDTPINLKWYMLVLPQPNNNDNNNNNNIPHHLTFEDKQS